MDAAFAPAPRRGATQPRGISHTGPLYRFQRAMAGGQARRKCAKGKRNFYRSSYAVANWPVAGGGCPSAGGSRAPIASRAPQWAKRLSFDRR